MDHAFFNPTPEVLERIPAELRPERIAGAAAVTGQATALPVYEGFAQARVHIPLQPLSGLGVTATATATAAAAPSQAVPPGDILKAAVAQVSAVLAPLDMAAVSSAASSASSIVGGVGEAAASAAFASHVGSQFLLHTKKLELACAQCPLDRNVMQLAPGDPVILAINDFARYAASAFATLSTLRGRPRNLVRDISPQQQVQQQQQQVQQQVQQPPTPQGSSAAQLSGGDDLSRVPSQPPQQVQTQVQQAGDGEMCDGVDGGKKEQHAEAVAAEDVEGARLVRPLFRYLVDRNTKRLMQEAVILVLEGAVRGSGSNNNNKCALGATTSCYRRLAPEKKFYPGLIFMLLHHGIIDPREIDRVLSSYIRESPSLPTSSSSSSSSSSTSTTPHSISTAAALLQVFVVGPRPRYSPLDFERTITEGRRRLGTGDNGKSSLLSTSSTLSSSSSSGTTTPEASTFESAMNTLMDARRARLLVEASARKTQDERQQEEARIACAGLFGRWCAALRAEDAVEMRALFAQIAEMPRPEDKTRFLQVGLLLALQQYRLAPPCLPRGRRCFALSAYGLLVLHLCQSAATDAELQRQYFAAALNFFAARFEAEGARDPRPFLHLLAFWAARFGDFPGNEGLAADQYEPLDVFYALLLKRVHPRKAPWFAYGWLEVISTPALLRRTLLHHRTTRRNWPMLQRQLVELLHFLGHAITTSEIVSKYSSSNNNEGKDDVNNDIGNEDNNDNDDENKDRDNNDNTPLQNLVGGTILLFLTISRLCSEFLAAYHFSLCNAVPDVYTNLRSIILCASPVRVPSPFAKVVVEQLPEAAVLPELLDDYKQVLLDAHIPIPDILACIDDPQHASYAWVRTHLLARESRMPPPAAVFNALVLFLGYQSAGGELNNKVYCVIKQVLAALPVDRRALMLNAIANQLRYPNYLSVYMSKTLIGLFNADTTEVTRELIVRILCERIQRTQFHPWGVIITCTELLLNPKYNLFGCPFLAKYPSVIKALAAYGEQFKKLLQRQQQ